jgi:hypothetical protein
MSIGQGWAKGLTKETSKGIAARAAKMRGRTKENNAGVAKSAAARTGPRYAHDNKSVNSSMPNATYGKCEICGKRGILGDAMCKRCWDEKDYE